MKKAYALLGLAFIILFGGTWFFTKNLDHDLKATDPMATLTLRSPVFEEGGTIPQKYSCDGEDVNPPLLISGVPEGTQSLLLVMDDPDAPVGDWDHWILYNIPPQTTEIPENTVPPGAVLALNSWGRNDYGGPCPPDKEHRYVFTLYALDTVLVLPETAQKNDVMTVIENHVLDTAKLTGRYDRER